MKKYLIILLLVPFLATAQTGFYFSNSGNDANACSFASPCASYVKFNSLSLVGGDTIYFARNSTFQGGFIVSGSGSLGDSIYITAYGSGAKPIINGLFTISSWTNEGGGIYGAACTGCNLVPQGNWGNLVAGTNTVLFNGTPGMLARWPNYAPGDGNGGGGYNNIDGSISGGFYDSAYQLRNGTFTSLVGVEAVYKESLSGPFSRGIINQDSVESGKTLIKITSFYNPTAVNGYGVFYQNSYQFLDTLYEWYLNPINDSLYAYLGAGGPSAWTIQVPIVDTLFAMTGTGCSGQSCSVQSKYVSINNIQLIGANDFNFASDGHHFTLNNVSTHYSGMNNILVGGLVTSKSDTAFSILNCTMSAAMGANLTSGYPNTYAGLWYQFKGEYNALDSAGIWPGNGPGYYNQGYGVATIGTHGIFRYNSIYWTGYQGIVVIGSYDSVDHNFISTFCTLLSDGGAIYHIPPTLNHTDTANYDGYNVIGNGVGNIYGTGNGSNPTPSGAQGIYLDNEGNNVHAFNNTIFNCAESGLKLHNGSFNTIKYNTFYGNKKEAIENDNDNSSYYPTNDTLTQNIYVSTIAGTTIPASFWYFWEDVLDEGKFDSLGISDSNYVASITNDSLKISVHTTTPNYTANLSLAGWRTYTGFDTHSTFSTHPYTTSNLPIFIYDSTATTETIILSDSIYTDVYGNAYYGKVTLQPYTSVVLFKLPFLVQNTGFVPSPGEYASMGLNTATGQAYYMSNGVPQIVTNTPASTAIVAGGAHHSGLIDNGGHVWLQGDNSAGELLQGDVAAHTGFVEVLTDTLGNTIDPVAQLICAGTAYGNLWSTTFLTITGKVYVGGNTQGGNEGNGTWGTATSTKAVPVTISGNPFIVKIQAGQNMMYLDSTGKVYTHGGGGYNLILGQGSSPTYTVPTSIAIGGNKCIDIAGPGRFAYMVMANGHIWALGDETDYMGIYPGGSALTVAQDITSYLSPYYTGTPDHVWVNSESSYLHMTNGTLYAWGGNVVGTIGNNIEPIYALYGIPPLYGTSPPAPYDWDQGQHELQQFNPVQLMQGKSNFTSIFTTNALCYGAYAADANGLLVAWGRNKDGLIYNSVVDANPTNGGIGATYPNSWDIPVPMYVNPMAVSSITQVTSPYCVLHPSSSPCNIYAIPSETAPVASATNQTLPPGQVILNGTASTYHYPQYLFWQQLTGPQTAAMTVQSALTDTIQLTTPGTYTFKFKVTDDVWQSDSTISTIIIGGSSCSNCLFFPRPSTFHSTFISLWPYLYLEAQKKLKDEKTIFDIIDDRIRSGSK